MKCRVISAETITIPPKSKMLIPIIIENSKYLANYGLIEHDQRGEKHVGTFLTRGVVDTNQSNTHAQMINTRNETVTIHALTHLGHCESYYELDQPCIAQCNRVLSDGNDQELTSQDLPDFLVDLWTRSTIHLDADDKQKVKKLLIDYQDVFSKSSDDLGRTDRVLHKINTGNAVPIRQAPRRLPLGKKEIEKEEIQKMLKRDVIEPSKSPWASPIVLVKKKDGTMRFCIDYRKVNQVVIKDAYPLPRTDECLDSLAGGKWFSCLDLNQGFFQVALHPDSREVTAFATSQGLYQFKVTPFGLVNSPSTFERLMEDVLRGLQWSECLLYIDDIIIPGANVEESLLRLEHVFSRLRDANLKLKPTKCILFQKSVKFLGHIVSEEGISTDPDKLKAIHEWPIPANVKEVKSFLGLCSYYRKFTQGFAEIARPLHQACKKETKFKWTEACQESFNRLKQCLTTSPILIYPIPGKQFLLDTDASNFAVGAVLSQEVDGNEHVIAYMSKALHKHELSYCTTRKELLAVVTALKNFHPYIYGQKVILRTDNAAVSWMTNLKNPTGQVARWLEQLGSYHLDIRHRQGKSHGNADALSRNPCKACKRQQDLEMADTLEEKAISLVQTDAKEDHINNLEAEDDLSGRQKEDTNKAVRIMTRSKLNKETLIQPNDFLLDGWTPQDLRTLQLEDQDIGLLLVAKEENKPRPKWEEVSSGTSSLKTYWSQWDRLEVQYGLLYRNFENGTTTRKQLILPTHKKQEVLKYYHDIPTAGHLGVEKTLERIKTSFYWSSMREYIQEYCRACDKCFARKPKRQTNRAPLGSYISGGPMERVALDILGPLPVTEKGNKYILVITDLFTKWTEAVAIPDQESKTICTAFIDNFITKFGTPLQLHSDQGRNFQSDIFRNTLSLLGIDQTRTTSLRPQSNGGVEKFNHTLAVMLTMYCEKQQNLWDTYLQQVMMAYRSSVQASTTKTPNSMVFGREIIMPLQALTPVPEFEKDTSEHFNSAENYVSNLKKKLEENYTIARKSLKKAAVYQKRHYDLKSRKNSFNVGQAVWIYDPSRKIGRCPKLTSKWKGPFIVEKKIDDTTYRVKRAGTKPSTVYHVDRLALYRGLNIPSWAVKYRNALLKEQSS